MKIIVKTRSKIVLRFDKDEELISQLVKFSAENNIKAAWINGLGACKKLELAYYNPDTKEYEIHSITENLEVTGIEGNIGMFENRPIVHAHGDFSKQDLSEIGGHIMSLVVSATLEIKLDVFQAEINRAMDKETCLKLMV